jgi:hypothetical protein
VPFVIIGGHAVNFHGYVRSNEVADLVWLRSRESEATLLSALTQASARYIGNEIDATTRIERTHEVTREFIATSHLMMLWTGSGFVDLFDYIPGSPEVDVGELFKTSVTADGLQYASLEWLRRMKQTAGRAKDKLDLENLPPQK